MRTRRGRLLTLLAMAACACLPATVPAHGERNQEPYLRMRSLHWYDTQWSVPDGATVKVNDTIVITGRVHYFSDWPLQIPDPDVVYLSSAVPGPVLVKRSSFINEVPAVQSSGAQLGRDYEYKLVLQARIPGRWHVHPMISVQGGGPLVGPGSWVNVEGKWEDFVYPVDTLTGEHIDNLEHYQVASIVRWHVFWIVVALFWLLWWLRRPMLLPRRILVRAGRESELVTRADVKVGVALLAGTIAIVVGAWLWTDARYPYTVPLQGGRARVEPLPAPAAVPKVRLREARYYVPGRSVTGVFEVTNTTDRPLRLGEMETANLRFVNRAFPLAMAQVPEGYPAEYLPNDGLLIHSGDGFIAPGETRRLSIEATDAAWARERLDSLLKDPDNTFGAVLFFYDPEGGRHMAEVSGPILPSFEGAARRL